MTTQQIRSALLVTVAGMSPGAWANTASETLSPGIGTADIAGLAVSLVVVIATVLVVGWLYSRSQSMRSGRGDVIRVLAAQALGSKERIVLVDVGGTQIVVGMTATQVQTLHVFETPVVDGTAAAATGAFSRKLSKLLKVPSR